MEVAYVICSPLMDGLLRVVVEQNRAVNKPSEA